ncbi:MAG TPA: inositol monophosphatase family protein [Pilimelia sp.]|nr:inositol monophosphatase family protein [Pilimelia sp.]
MASRSSARTDGCSSPVRFAKSATDFATDTDIDAEKAIRSVLRAARPADAYRGEELGAAGSADRTWLVDPLCGTLNFAARSPLMAVNVALRERGRVAVAASADPLTGEVFWTDGSAANVRRDGTDVALTPSAEYRLVDVNLDAPQPNADRFRAVTMLADPAFGTDFQPRVLSTTLALAWVAAGRRAAYVTAGELRDSVHFAAGIALCEAAGCVVTGLVGQPLHTGVGGLVAAADGDTHAALLDIIGRQFESG